MAAKPLPSPEVLRQLLSYDPETGNLFWKERGPEWFKGYRNKSAESVCASWNKRFSGKKAGATGQRCVSMVGVLGHKLLGHRVAWAIFHGAWPVNVIDHINGDSSDNRILNMRDVTQRDNVKNSKAPKNNSSGHVGVTWRRDLKKWRARISSNDSKHKHLGVFDRLEDAIYARKSAESIYGYHHNHGR